MKLIPIVCVMPQLPIHFPCFTRAWWTAQNLRRGYDSHGFPVLIGCGKNGDAILSGE
jgi:hypothetical protein